LVGSTPLSFKFQLFYSQTHEPNWSLFQLTLNKAYFFNWSIFVFKGIDGNDWGICCCGRDEKKKLWEIEISKLLRNWWFLIFLLFNVLKGLTNSSSNGVGVLLKFSVLFLVFTCVFKLLFWYSRNSLKWSSQYIALL
jgi:hypothetical protein